MISYLSPLDSGIKLSTVEVMVEQMNFSFIHRKRELMNIFLSKIKTLVKETEDEVKVVYEIGFF